MKKTARGQTPSHPRCNCPATKYKQMRNDFTVSHEIVIKKILSRPCRHLKTSTCCRDIFLIYVHFAVKKIILCEANNVKVWNLMRNIIFHSLLALHRWPYTTLAVFVCAVLKSLAILRALTKVCPEDCGWWPTLPDTFSLLPPRTTHTFSRRTHFIITSSPGNIIEVSCAGTCSKITRAISAGVRA